MKEALGNRIKKYHEYFYIIFRVFVGLLFFQHGAQKLFGWFGAKGTVELFSLMGFVGIIEFFGGLAIAIGLLTRLAALGSVIIMIGAYFKAHFPNGWMPIMNRGELALMFLVAFLIILVQGARKWSLEKALFKKELF